MAVIPEGQLEEWKKEASRVAISGYKFILEDDPDWSERAEGSGDESLEGVCAPGCTSLDCVRLTEEQARIWRERIRAGGQRSAPGIRPGPAGIVSKD
jgi:hypothetical protein